MVFGRLFDGAARRRRRAVENLYDEVVACARNPWLYADGGVPDTFDGRFEMMVWHLAFAVRRLRGAGPEAKAFSQDLFDHFLDDMNRSMREAAVGDIAIPKRLQKMVRVWFGRIRALEGIGEPSAKAVEAVLVRNLYPDADTPPQLNALANLLTDRWRAAEATTPENILQGRTPFEVQEQPA